MLNKKSEFINFKNNLPQLESSGLYVYGKVMDIAEKKEHTLNNIDFVAQVMDFETSHEESFIRYLNFIKNKNCKNFFSIRPTECTSPVIHELFMECVHDKDIIKIKKWIDFDNELNELDCNLYYIYGSHEPELYTKILNELNFKRIKILYWPTYLITHTFNLLMSGFIENEDDETRKFENLNLVTEFEKLYINYNNRPRIHRKIMMDLLCKKKMLNDGYNSWNVLSTEESGTDVVSTIEYETKYWYEKILNLDDYKIDKKNYSEEHSDTMLFPNALFSLVGETSMDVPYVTEKTFRCFFFKQPFISYGAKGQNKEILKYGFKLFDNIIDYSFDDESDYEKRFEMLLDELLKFKDKNYKEIYKQIEPILEHNNKRVYDLLLKDEFVPIELLKVYENRN